MKARSRTVVLAANSLWYITNFRTGLIRALAEAGYQPIVLGPVDAVQEKRLAELGSGFEPVSIDRKGLNPFAELSLLLHYRRILTRLKPFAFLGFTIKPNIYGALAASKLDIPVIANVSGLGTAFIRPGLLQHIVNTLYRLAFKRVMVFFENPDDRQLFVERKLVRAEQTRLVPGCGIDLDHFAPTPVPVGPPKFLLIARLIGDKGVREFVKAARTSRRRMPDARFRLLGGLDEGNRTSITPSELQAWIDEGVIEHLGETDDVRPFIDDATGVVLPSYREGLPRSLLEGGAMGRPLIATDVPGCREVVDNGVNGYLCSVRDPASLAAAMERLGALPQAELNAMGAASRRKVQEQFSEELVVRAYLDALSALQSG